MEQRRSRSVAGLSGATLGLALVSLAGVLGYTVSNEAEAGALRVYPAGATGNVNRTISISLPVVTQGTQGTPGQGTSGQGQGQGSSGQGSNGSC